MTPVVMSMVRRGEPGPTSTSHSAFSSLGFTFLFTTDIPGLAGP